LHGQTCRCTTPNISGHVVRSASGSRFQEDANWCGDHPDWLLPSCRCLRATDLPRDKPSLWALSRQLPHSRSFSAGRSPPAAKGVGFPPLHADHRLRWAVPLYILPQGRFTNVLFLPQRPTRFVPQRPVAVAACFHKTTKLPVSSRDTSSSETQGQRNCPLGEERRCPPRILSLDFLCQFRVTTRYVSAGTSIQRADRSNRRRLVDPRPVPERAPIRPALQLDILLIAARHSVRNLAKSSYLQDNFWSCRIRHGVNRRSASPSAPATCCTSIAAKIFSSSDLPASQPICAHATAKQEGNVGRHPGSTDLQQNSSRN